MKRKKPEPIETTELCKYGCGNIAKFKSSSGFLMCGCGCTTCPVNKQKNKESILSSSKHKSRDYDSRYANISDETKKNMAWSKGLDKNTHPSLEQQGKSFSINNKTIDGHNGSPRGVAIDPTMRWKRTRISYTDSAMNQCFLESYHEFEVANILDKHGIYWIRPKYIKLKDGRRYEPDFYLRDFDVYLDPKSLWDFETNTYGQKIVKAQTEQLEKIKLCMAEKSCIIIILNSTNKDSHTWDGIKKQIEEKTIMPV